MSGFGWWASNEVSVNIYVELHLLVEDLISSVSAEAYEKLYLVLSDFLPLLLSFGDKSGLSGTSTLFDTLLQEYRI